MPRWSRQTQKELHPDDVRMTLGEHLEELRTRLIRATIGLAVGMVVCWIFVEQILGFLVAPMYAVLEQNNIPARIVALNPAENFLVSLKVAFIVGFIVSAPYSLIQIWGFVAAGLYKHERKWVHKFTPASIILFFSGAFFLLIIVLPLLLNFLVMFGNTLPDTSLTPAWLLGKPEALKPAVAQPAATQSSWPTTQPMSSFKEDPAKPPEGVQWVNLAKHEIRMRVGEKIFTVAHLDEVQNRKKIEPMMRYTEYVTFALHLSAAFGIGFQVPVVVSFLAVLGIVSAADMTKLRRYVWFGMAVGAAFLTPPDIASMFLLLVPMALLYEAGLCIARLIERKRAASGG